MFWVIVTVVPLFKYSAATLSLYHNMHAVVHLHKLARRCFSMGGTEQLKGQDSVRKSKCVSACMCIEGIIVLDEECEIRLGAGQMSLVCMRLKMCVVQPVPYEPCHGRPDSQPARPRLPPGCGSRIQSSPSAGAPLPLRTLDLKQRYRE